MLILYLKFSLTIQENIKSNSGKRFNQIKIKIKKLNIIRAM